MTVGVRIFILLWILISIKVSPSHCDSIIFDYHVFDIGPQCTTVGWNYIGESCSPVKFNLRGFYREDITSNSLHPPRISLNSNSSLFKLPTGLLRGNTLYFRIQGIDAEDRICSATFSNRFYDFSTPLENDWQSLCLTQQTSTLCTPVPQATVSLSFVWPKTSSSRDNYCYCTPTAEYFSGCAESCETNYHFTYNSMSNTVCLQNSSSVWESSEPLKVYYIHQSNLCFSTLCISSYFTSSYWIMHQAPCNAVSLLRDPSRSQQNTILHYPTLNYTISVASVVRINVTYEPNNIIPHLLIWTHNGHIIDMMDYLRVDIHSDGSLTIGDVQKSDAGRYVVSVSNDLGCDSAEFSITVEYLDISESTVFNDSLFRCVATGYPDVQLLMWQSGTGDVIPQSHYNTSSEDHEFSTTLVSTLAVDNRDACGQLWGYTCVFNNGGSPDMSKSSFMQCQPGKPRVLKIQLIESNSSLCFDAYSHPDYPVEYTVTITGNNLNNTATDRPLVLPWHTAVNTTECVTLDSEVPSDLCGPVLMSVMATNGLGTTQRNYNLIKVQICLQTLISCENWIAEALDAKLGNFAENLQRFIRNITFYRPSFICSTRDPNCVTFTAQVLAFSDVHHNQIVEIVQEWVLSTTSVIIQGEMFQIRHQCPVAVSAINDPKCSEPSASYFAIMGGISAGIIATFVILLFIVICVIFKKKRSKNNNDIQPHIYEEINDCQKLQDIPLYEQIIPVKKQDPHDCKSQRFNQEYAEITTDEDQHEYRFTECEAYGMAKKI